MSLSGEYLQKVLGSILSNPKIKTEFWLSFKKEGEPGGGGSCL